MNRLSISVKVTVANAFAGIAFALLTSLGCGAAATTVSGTTSQSTNFSG